MLYSSGTWQEEGRRALGLICRALGLQAGAMAPLRTALTEQSRRAGLRAGMSNWKGQVIGEMREVTGTTRLTGDNSRCLDTH